ncbi:hypothetical protein DPMN_185386 [Dreissena polymorpha]|uniref:Uncharacterized protein n=1 Tax=Dreissena polymorpha TaxID=45954 RepID=A0A9D4I5I1_DREPO|nr:hypothetical protein DPMN_185386 [Dreissena polymorpha]
MGETLGTFQTKVVGYLELLHIGNGDTVPQLAAKQRFGNDCGLVQFNRGVWVCSGPYGGKGTCLLLSVSQRQCR